MKKDLLSRWLAHKEGKSKKVTIKESNRYPLAYNQQALYFLDQLFPGNPFYNYLDFYQLKGNLDLDLFVEAFRLLIDRHEVLRTRIDQESDGPIQIVETKGKLEVNQYQISKEGVSQERAEQLIVSDARKPIDLSSDSQVRLSVVNDSSGSYWVGVVIHHIFIDKWSMSQVRNEVVDIYNKLSSGEPVEAFQIPLNYGEFARLQLERELDPEDMNFWLKKLKDANEVFELPTDFVRPKFPTFKGAHYTTRIPEDTSKVVRALGHRLKVTPFVLLLSVFKILLFKLSGKTHLNIGVPVTNKESSGLERVIGFFDETVIIRTDFKNGSAADFIHNVRNNVFEAFEHKKVPLELLVKELHPDRDISINPLFQTMFIYHKEPEPPVFNGNISFKSRSLDIGVSKFDLSLFVGEDESGFYTSFEYATDLFKEATIKSFAGYYNHLLSQVIENPDVPLSQLRLLSDAETAHMLRAWNDTAFQLKREDNILELIAHQAARFPNSIALADASTRITYATLQERSDRVACYLQHKGLGKGHVVGLWFDRSLSMVVSMLGVMKSGAAYLPLDPEYPSRRIRYMVEDAQAVAIIGETGSLETISGMGCPVYAYDQILEAAFEVGDPVQVGMDDLAYVIYTSGSTGKPKGVAVTHLNLLNSTVSRHRYYPDQPGQFLLFSSFSFDSSVAGIFWTLSSGGKLVISQRRLEQDMEALGKVFEQEEITHTLLLPALYGEVLQSVSLEKIKKLKCVIVAGEACHEAVANNHFATLPKTRLYNEYGPTEATVWATVEEIDPDSRGTISIGKPIGNTEVFILDTDMQPVPPGVPGEIYIGGLNVARGYLNNQEATAQKFLDNPFDTGSDRLYKSGDLGKYDDAGKIVFLGRADEQVKVRGHRVELIEIENQIKRFPGIVESVVKMTGSNERGVRIVCYFTQSNEIDESKLRSQLLEELPNYMVPAEFVCLSEMPRLPNGKVDFNRLKEFEITTQSTEIELPVSDQEKAWHEIWREVLKQDRIGIHDNFFELGGDSILSIRIISMARGRGLDVKPNQIFENQTIYELAKNTVDHREGKDETSQPFVGDSVPTPFQKRFFQYSLKDPALGFQTNRIKFEKTFARERIMRAVGTIINSNDALRIIFSIEHDSVSTRYKSFEIDDFIEIYKPDSSLTIVNAIHQSFDLNGGPLFKLFLMSDPVEDDSYDTVLLSAHRSILDPGSWSRLISQFASALEANRDKQDGTYKSSVPTPFRYWAENLASEEVDSEFRGQLSFWNDELKTVAGNGRLSSGAADRLVKTYHVNGKILQQLQGEALNAYNLEMNDFFRIVYVQTLSEFFGRQDFVVWTEKEGRKVYGKSKDYSETIGCFTSYFPISVKLETDLKSTIINIKEKYRSVPLAGIGYEHLRNHAQFMDLDLTEKYYFSHSGPISDFDQTLIASIERLHPIKLSGNSEWRHFLHLHCDIGKDTIECVFIFDSSVINQGDMDRFVLHFGQNLDRFIDHCAKAGVQYTPGDFPEADLSDDDLNALLGQL